MKLLTIGIKSQVEEKTKEVEKGDNFHLMQQSKKHQLQENGNNGIVWIQILLGYAQLVDHDIEYLR